ncbi:MAG: YaiI/YqxD family protein [Candidatus Hydrogenedens sp.]|nr:YaiI/YqxD family protein [Candidatus Hydrogenedens sp.]
MEETPGTVTPTIYVDADACPVKEETYRVAQRHGLPVVLVSNMWMRIPDHPWLSLEVVSDHFDAADDWIAERAGTGDIVITADIPLASRCVANGARVLGHKGQEFTERSIGETVATRDLMARLRDDLDLRGGPPPFAKKDRSQFLQKLDEIARKVVSSR